MSDDSDGKKPKTPKTPKKAKSPSKYTNAPYEVGKGKPPKNNQFTTGNKGGGRKAGSKNRSDFDKLLDTKTQVGEDRLGRPIRKTYRQMLDRTLLKKAMDGDMAAMRLIKDYEIKMAAIKLRYGEPPLTEAQIKKDLEELEERKKLSAEIADFMNLSVQMKKVGIMGADKGNTGLQPWVYEALSDYREKLGLPRDPGRGGRWAPGPENEDEP